MRFLSDNVLAKLQSGLAAPFEGEDETEVDLHLKGQIFGERFEIDRWLGSGGMGTVYQAVDAETGEACVIKLIHPSFVGRDGKGATLAVLKEATALGALRDQVPHPPHVVRLLGTGTIVADVLAGEVLELPWIALEYVDGGEEGTTLEERVGHAVRTTGNAFDPRRVARAAEAIGQGLDAVHKAHVVHRDVKPANVLCSGTGDKETFKLADFGVSRPLGVAGTFGGLLVGTPGYAPPELMAIADAEIGPWTDVFGFAALVYFMLAGDHYFPVNATRDALRAVRKPERKKLRDGRSLAPELRADEAACRAVDEALARATAPVSRARTQEASVLAQAIVRALTPVAPLPSQPPRSAPPRSVPPRPRPRFTWSVRRPEPPSRAVFRAAWDGPGRCLLATPDGVFFWNGTRFHTPPGCAELPTVRFVERIGPGRWLVGGDRATFGVCTERGVADVVQGADPSVRFQHFSGELGDLGVLVGVRAGVAPALYALVGRHWLKPLPLASAPELRGIARIDATRWLLGGKARDGAPFAATYEPLAWEVTPIPSQGKAPLVACAGDPNRRRGIAIASEGVAWLIGENDRRLVTVQAGAALSAAHVDEGGSTWVGGSGRLWVKGSEEASFGCVYQSEDTAPFLALSSQGGNIVAMATDFTIVEGRRA